MTDQGDLGGERVERILTAVETIERSLRVLAEKQSVEREEFVTDSDVRDVVERRFVKMTEAALDIGNEVLLHERGRPAESNPSAMQSLGDLGVLDDGTAAAMARAARFRNVLAHTYGDVLDEDVIYDALQDLERYRSYLEQAVRTSNRPVRSMSNRRCGLGRRMRSD